MKAGVGDYFEADFGAPSRGPIEGIIVIDPCPSVHARLASHHPQHFLNGYVDYWSSETTARPDSGFFNPIRVIVVGKIRRYSVWPADIIAKRWALTPINPDHLTRLIELGLVEMREDKPFVTVKGQDVAWIAD